MDTVNREAIIVVDSNNHWLYYDTDPNIKDAIKEARNAEKCDPEATLYIYKTTQETRINS